MARYTPQNYTPLSGKADGEEDVFSPTSSSVTEKVLPPRPSKTDFQWSKYMRCLTLGLTVVNIAMFIVNIHIYNKEVWRDERYVNDNLNKELKKTSSYCMVRSFLCLCIILLTFIGAPIFDMVDLHPRLQAFNGAIHDNSSIYRQPPSPAVDAAWDLISTAKYQLTTVSAADIRYAGKKPETSVKAPESWGRGPDAYPAQIDVFHQIHCLNELRKEIYFDYYYSSGVKEKIGSGLLHQQHKQHCIHMLLQNLMCHADVDMVTHNWIHNDRFYEPKTRPFPDFSLNRMCRDFDTLLKWVMDKATVDEWEEKWNVLRIPEGAEIIPGDGYGPASGESSD